MYMYLSTQWYTCTCTCTLNFNSGERRGPVMVKLSLVFWELQLKVGIFPATQNFHSVHCFEYTPAMRPVSKPCRASQTGASYSLNGRRRGPKGALKFPYTHVHVYVYVLDGAVLYKF